ncbi:MAG: hypothetical protein ACYDDU_11545 [Dermatophilaceae bacterium]
MSPRTIRSDGTPAGIMSRTGSIARLERRGWLGVGASVAGPPGHEVAQQVAQQQRHPGGGRDRPWRGRVARDRRTEDERVLVWVRQSPVAHAMQIAIQRSSIVP